MAGRRKLDEWGEDLVAALKWAVLLIVAGAVVVACIAIARGGVIVIR